MSFIGTSFANEFNLTPGDLINLSLPGDSTQSFIVGGIFDLEIVVKRDNLLLVVFISTMAGLISSFVPARKSSSLNPMEVIRNG